MGKKPTKVKTQVRIMKPDLLDLIRDEIYGAAIPCGELLSGPTSEIMFIRTNDVAKLAKRIAKRAIIGH